MPITATEKPDAVADRSATTKRWNVVATLDADTTLSVPHGLGALPGFDITKVHFWFVPLIAEARLSNWLVFVDATNLNIEKTILAGSGAAGVQMVLYIALPHSVL